MNNVFLGKGREVSLENISNEIDIEEGFVIQQQEKNVFYSGDIGVNAYLQNLNNRNMNVRTRMVKKYGRGANRGHAYSASSEKITSKIISQECCKMPYYN